MPTKPINHCADSQCNTATLQNTRRYVTTIPAMPADLRHFYYFRQYTKQSLINLSFDLVDNEYIGGLL